MNRIPNNKVVDEDEMKDVYKNIKDSLQTTLEPHFVELLQQHGNIISLSTAMGMALIDVAIEVIGFVELVANNGGISEDLFHHKNLSNEICPMTTALRVELIKRFYAIANRTTEVNDLCRCPTCGTKVFVPKSASNFRGIQCPGCNTSHMKMSFIKEENAE